MNPEEQQDLRAAEYVLGTLDGTERVEVENELRESDDLRRRVEAWESRLVGLNDLISPVAPPARTWAAIERRLGFSPVPRAAGVTGAGLWRALALVASVACLVLAVLLVREQALLLDPSFAPPQSVVLRTSDQQPLWLLQVNWQAGTVSAEVIEAIPPDKGKDHQLWLLGAADEAPLSLGLLPANGRVTHTFAHLPEHRLSASAVAVSLEPAGGSPTGQPTGPVLYSAPLPIPTPI
jgi:anti-sigma-K factor RskA